jgi:hypothetical protein
MRFNMEQATQVKNSTSAGRRRVTGREVVLAVLAVIALLAAVFCFALYNAARVPADAAAKVNDSYLAEERVASEIAQYRMAYGLTDDTDFASALLSQNLNVSTFRQNIINQLALTDIIAKRAEELGIEPADEEAQAQLDATKRSLAFDDDEVWEQTLASYGLSEDFLRSQYLANFRQQAVFEVDVSRREPTEGEELAYIQQYLANTTQKHASRILFVGDDAYTRAKACHEWLQSEADEEGGITAEDFAAAVREYSDEEGAAATGGSFAWSGSGEMSEDITEVLEYLAVGSFSNPQSAGEDKVLEILYCDEEYTFPATEAISSIVELDVPEELEELIRTAATEAVWTQDCSAYMAALLLSARITYYPFPDDAVYAVNMALVSSEGSDG